MAKTTALVTGASSGIGAEFARVHAAAGGDLIIAARRRDRLEELAAELRGTHGARVHVVAVDLAQPDAAQRLYDDVKGAGLQVDYLINNAGFGGHCFFHEEDWARHAAMIQVNAVALAQLCHLFARDMAARGQGRILNVSSVAGFLPGPMQAVYYATKGFVVLLSEALANELASTGVTVTVLCPGATASEFADQAGVGDTVTFKAGTVSARSVAEFGYAKMRRGVAVAIPGASNKLLVQSLRAMPRALVRRVSRLAMAKTA